jgi:hypothetical protein
VSFTARYRRQISIFQSGGRNLWGVETTGGTFINAYAYNVIGVREQHRCGKGYKRLAAEPGP